MKTIILAAGKSPRLLPLTEHIPQALLKVGQRTILEIQIENLKQAGLKDIVVVTGYLSEKLEEFCQKLKIKTLFNPFYNVSGIAMSLWIAKEELKNGFIFLYSDVLFNSEAVEGLLKIQKDICLAIKKDGLREEAEKVVEEEGIIKSVSKINLSQGNGEFIGIAKFSDRGALEIIKELEDISRQDINASFIKVIDSFIKKGGQVGAYNIRGARFVDIDFPEDLKKAEEIFGQL